MIEIVPDGPLAAEALERFEAKHGLKIPDEYRTWLQATGGGEAVADYQVENGVVSEFLGLGTAAVAYDLDSWRSSSSGFSIWVPEDFLIIAPASGGSLCLKLSEPQRGSVWWADYDAAEELPGDAAEREESLPEIMRKIAETFGDLLQDYPS